MSMTDLGEEFLVVSRRQLQTRRERILVCLERLTHEQIWARAHETENAVGNLVLHLVGNVSEWILAGIGDRDVTRHRDTEFACRDPLPREALVRRLGTTLEDADRVLAAVRETDLLRRRTIQGYDVTVLHAVYHVVEHFAEHTGQIIWATKRMTGADLGFYRSLESARNEIPGAWP